MNLFGEYLVEQKYISAADLLKLLVEQVRTAPSLMEVTFEAQLLEPEEILAVLSLQHNRGSDFKTACHDLGYWTPALEEKIQQELLRKKIPLGQLVMEAKLMSMQELVSALDKFMQENEKKSKTATVVEPSLEKSSETKAVMPFTSLSDTGVLELQDLFSSDCKNILMEQLELLTSSPASPKEREVAGQRCMVEIHTLRGGAKFLRLNRLEELLSVMEQALGKIKNKPSEVQDWILLSDGVRVSWDLCTSVVANKSEEFFFNQSDLQQQYLETLNLLKRF